MSTQLLPLAQSKIVVIALGVVFGREYSGSVKEEWNSDSNNRDSNHHLTNPESRITN